MLFCRKYLLCTIQPHLLSDRIVQQRSLALNVSCAMALILENISVVVIVTDHVSYFEVKYIISMTIYKAVKVVYMVPNESRAWVRILPERA